MTIHAVCVICKSPDRRRAVELMWNGGMSALAISEMLGGTPVSSTILKHLKHADGDGNARAIEVHPELPVRERVLALQRMQLDEIERRVELAKQRATEMNDWHAKRIERGEEDGESWSPVDWSSFHDILGKDMQAAIGSILKTQGLSDKREKVQGDQKLGLFEAMVGAGLAPKDLIGGKMPDLPALPPGEDVDD